MISYVEDQVLTIARGQSIEILTSSAAGRSHPIAGDKGFISNAYLCPNEKFIICDIYFFRFGNEAHTRCERKLFIIDLGINSSTKKNLLEGCTRSKFSLVTDKHVNLAATFTYLNNNIGSLCVDSLPKMFGNTGIFRGPIRRPITKSMEAIVKIPYGTVRHPLMPREITDPNVALALFKSVRPVLNGLITGINSIKLVSVHNSLLDELGNLISGNFFFASVPDHFSAVRTLIYNPVDDMPSDKLIEYTRKIQSITALVSRKSTYQVINEIMLKHRQENTTTYSAPTLAILGLLSWFNENSKEPIPFIKNNLSHLIFRVMFSSRTSEEIYEFFQRLMKEEGVLSLFPKGFSAWSMTNKIMVVRREGADDSAALARFFENDFFVERRAKPGLVQVKSGS